MTFGDIRGRLLERVRRLVDNGSINETQLARRVGFSQSHLNNTLRGVRIMTLQTADQFLDRLGWSVTDLLCLSELEEARRGVRAAKVRGRYLPIEYVRTTKQPGGNHPKTERKSLVPRSYLSLMVDPVVLATDNTMDLGGYAMLGDCLLADYAITPRASDAAFLFSTSTKPHEDLDETFAIRWIRRGSRCSYAVESSPGTGHALSWTRVDDNRLIARIYAIAKPPGDTFLPPAPPSAAN